MCMRKIPCDKDSVSTLKSSNLVNFNFHMFSARAGVFSPGAGVFFARAGGEKPGVCTALPRLPTKYVENMFDVS